jgi:hypothetical protein
LALLGLGLLALALFRVRYRLEWRGEWSGSLSGTQEGTIQIRYGFPGFTKTWNPLEDDAWTPPNPFDIDDDEDNDNAKTTEAASAGPGDPFSSPETPSEPPPAKPVEPRREAKAPGKPREEPYFLKDGPHRRDAGPNYSRPAASDRSKKDPNRKRRALFRFITDADVWKFFTRYGLKAISLVFGLLKPRAEAALGHPDPVRLGRLAGKWYAVRPFLPLGDTVLHFRFQDRHPTLWVKAEGGFSLLGVVGFGLRLLLSFPLIRFGRSAWKGWRQHRLTGWRAWVYHKLQAR